MQKVSLERDFAGIAPATVSREALEDPESVIMAEIHGTPVICVYCRRSQAFAYWLTYGTGGQGIWASHSPLEFRDLMEFCTAEGFRFPVPSDLERWIAHIQGPAVRSANQ